MQEPIVKSWQNRNAWAPALEVEAWKGRTVTYLYIRAGCDLRSFCHAISDSPELGRYQASVTDEDVGHAPTEKAGKWRSPDLNVKDRTAEGSLPFA